MISMTRWAETNSSRATRAASTSPSKRPASSSTDRSPRGEVHREVRRYVAPTSQDPIPVALPPHHRSLSRRATLAAPRPRVVPATYVDRGRAPESDAPLRACRLGRDKSPCRKRRGSARRAMPTESQRHPQRFPGDRIPFMSSTRPGKSKTSCIQERKVSSMIGKSGKFRATACRFCDRSR